jgi:hypothetical protein
MLGKLNYLQNEKSFNCFSEFVSTKIIHELYQICCAKRFLPFPVETLTPPPRTTLYKYLVIPKEGQQPPPPPPPEIKEPKTPTEETQPSGNPFAQRYAPYPQSDQQPPEIKRRTTQNSSFIEHETRPRSDTLPFINPTEQLEYISTMRSGGNGPATTRRNQHHSKHDEQQGEDQ